jgi:hypothetical protein
MPKLLSTASKNKNRNVKMKAENHKGFLSYAKAITCYKVGPLVTKLT